MRVEDDRDATTNAGAPAEDGDAELLARVARRDQQAFQSLYLAYHRRLARFLIRITHRYDVAEEIINDTLWVVWCKAGDFRGESKVSTWIMGIAYRRALKAMATPLMRTPTVDIATEEEALASEELQRTAELTEVLEQALARLPLEQRMVLELTYYLGHSCGEIAAIMDCPVNTVKTRMFHARRKLRTLLPQLDGSSNGARA